MLTFVAEEENTDWAVSGLGQTRREQRGGKAEQRCQSQFRHCKRFGNVARRPAVTRPNPRLAKRFLCKTDEKVGLFFKSYSVIMDNRSVRND